MGCCLEHEFVNQLSIQTTFSDSQADYNLLERTQLIRHVLSAMSWLTLTQGVVRCMLVGGQCLVTKH